MECEGFKLESHVRLPLAAIQCTEKKFAEPNHSIIEGATS